MTYVLGMAVADLPVADRAEEPAAASTRDLVLAKYDAHAVEAPQVVIPGLHPPARPVAHPAAPSPTAAPRASAQVITAISDLAIGPDGALRDGESSSGVRLSPTDQTAVDSLGLYVLADHVGVLIDRCGVPFPAPR